MAPGTRSRDKDTDGTCSSWTEGSGRSIFGMIVYSWWDHGLVVVVVVLV